MNAASQQPSGVAPTTSCQPERRAFSPVANANLRPRLIALLRRAAARAAADRLEWDAFVPNDHVRVAVDSGWITLEGAVPFGFQRRAAETAVQTLVGVRGVTNDIVVAPTPSGPNIKTAIEHALRRRAAVEAQGVTVETDDGTVVLSGHAGSWPEFREMERVAQQTPGVRRVRNEIVLDDR